MIKTMIRHQILVSVILFFLPVFNLLAAEKIIYPSGTLDYIGRGYDNVLRKFTDSCVQGSEAWVGGRTLNFQEFRCLDNKRILDESKGVIKAKLDLFVFSAKAKVEMHVRHSESQKRMSNTFIVNYDAGTVALREPTLTPLGSQVVNETLDVKRKTCGNRYVEGVKLGAKVHLTANLHFYSKEDYEKFKITIKIKSLFGSKKKRKQRIIKRNVKNGVFSITMDQTGGDQTKLNSILSQNPTYCSVETMEECFKTLELLHSYLISPTGFITTINKQNLAVTHYNVASYKNSMQFDLASDGFKIVDPGFVDIEKQLEEKFEENINHREYYHAMKYRDNPDATHPNIVECDAQIIIANNNLNKLKNAFSICESSDYQVCSSEVQSAINSLEPLIQ